MKYSFFFTTDATVLCLLLFTACILMVMLGKFIRNRFIHNDQQESKGGVNSLLGALFGLWGFILAFTFGSSATRFDSVRTIMVDESNTIRNAIFRAKVFPDSIRDGLNADLKLYLEARTEYYKYAADPDKFSKAKQEGDEISEALWEKTVKASALPNLTTTSANMFAALASIFDIADKRDALMLSGVPEPITYMLFFLAIAISFVGGFTTPVIKTKEWIVIAGFILLACIIIYITLDLGRPLRGFIRPDIGEYKIYELKKFF
jgi:hypothetical protein